MTSSIARCIFKCGGKDSRLCQEAKGIICNSSNWSLLLKNQGRRVTTHQRVSRTGLGWGGHGQWLREEPAESGRGGSKSLALTVKSGSGDRNLWSLPLVVWEIEVPQRGGLRSGDLASSRALGCGGGQSQSQGATTSRVEKPPRISGTRRLSPGALIYGGQ